MLRSILIYLSKATWARRLVTRWKFSWRAASRFVAGEELADAIGVVKTLNHKGISVTLDHLGENTTNPDAARRATRDIIAILDEIHVSRVQANVSIKLTQIGLALDEALCEENLTLILERAREQNNFVRIDMEDSPWTEKTLNLFRKMRNERGFDNVGVVIQAYLRRSEGDIRQLNRSCSPIRLCKGAYKEPSNIAFPAKGDVDANYDRLARLLMDNALAENCPPVSEDHCIPPTPAIATHDERRISYVRSYAKKIGLPINALEFQMLYGIRRDIQEKLASAGYPVRVYVPYGTEWYPYFVRRLAERPANLWFFVSNLFRR